MKREAFLAVYNEVLGRAKQIIVPKNQDYGANEDALRNFRLAESIGGDAGRGIQYRMLDKMARAWTLHDNAPATKSETMEDTLLDLINYSAIYIAWMREEQEKDTTVVIPVPLPEHPLTRALRRPHGGGEWYKQGKWIGKDIALFGEEDDVTYTEIGDTYEEEHESENQRWQGPPEGNPSADGELG